ncbi:MAG: pyridoxamine 5'-phosphate oxidase family protein [Candidatus Methanomethylophilaceae archaeon]|nr:pyridoxamine 5'-phosphate oxidase family protein [Candidatus Methanomethylophilaceae archaeon]
MQPNMMNNQLKEDEIVSLLDRCDVGAISTIGADGYPYSTPVNFVQMDGVVYIHGRRVGEKMDNIKNDSRVCFTAWERYGYEHCGIAACDTTTVYESVIIKGDVEMITDDGVKAKVLLAIVEKLVPGKTGMDLKKVPPTAIYRIVPKSVTGKYHRPMPGNIMCPRNQ